MKSDCCGAGVIMGTEKVYIPAYNEEFIETHQCKKCHNRCTPIDMIRKSKEDK